PEPGGGLRISRSADNDNKIVSLAFGDCSNDHAFQQDIGFGPGPLFEINDGALRSKILLRLRQVFEKFKRERRYELVEGSIKVNGADTSGKSDGEFFLEFRYVSLEANEE